MEDKTKIFIEKAVLKHGNKYDYSKVEYVNNTTPVCIICHKLDKFGREHGEFWQTPKDHLRGNKCIRCRCNVLNLTDFILYANDVHNNKYDYSKSTYLGANKLTTIICPLHGEFQMRPANHLNGQGCPICANKERGSYRKNNTQNFILRASEKHNNKYDYSKVEYINNWTKVCIICPEHGEFWQKPNDHLKGSGCAICGQKYNKTELDVLDLLKEHYKNVEYQHKEEFLASKTSYQTIDFFLPDFNIGIEYHGRQHFRPIKRFGGEDGYTKTCERDKRKYDKCIKNGIKMYYLTFEKCDTEKYFTNVYKNINDLFFEIDKNNKINT